MKKKMVGLWEKYKSGGWVPKTVASAVLALLVGFLYFYVALPPINLMSVEFWIWLTFIALSASVPFLGIKVTKQSTITFLTC